MTHRRSRQYLVFASCVWLAASAAPASAATITAELQTMLDSTRRRIPVVIRMVSQIDPYAVAASASTKADRVRAIIQALQNRATATQDAPTLNHPDGLLTELREAELYSRANARNIQTFWGSNAVYVEAVPSVIYGAAGRPDIATVSYAGRRNTAGPSLLPGEVQWNIDRVHAPAVWALGFRGAGAVVASIDSGARDTHPILAANALQNAFGAPLWLDALRGHTTPYDESGHGTYVLGIAVGADGFGVAPDAKWMACKAFKRRRTGIVGTATDILECAQWVLNPDAPADPDPTHLPDVILNAWALADPTGCDPILQDVVRVWRAAGMLPVFAVGDAVGVAPSDAVPSPANYPEAFSVGASDRGDEMASFSFRGTASCGGSARPAPRVLAPGVDVTSAVGSSSLRTKSGTDAAAAHVAGAVALMRNAHPQLTVDQIDAALQRSARDFIGGPTYQPGILDVLSAVRAEDAAPAGVVVPVGVKTTNAMFPATVTMRNTGVTRWEPGVHRLAAVPDIPTWGLTRVDLNQPVEPGAQGTFSFQAKAPSTPNLDTGHPFQWRMFHEGIGYFGEPSTPVSVLVARPNDALFVAQTPPEQSNPPGDCHGVSVTLQNRGTNTWSAAAGYRLASANPQDNMTWGLNRVSLAPGDSIGFNGQKRFDFQVCNPQVQGTYTFSWRMVQEGVEHFGEPSNPVNVQVSGFDDAEVCGISFPTELRVGLSADVIVCMRNAGSNAWVNGYCLKPLQGFGGLSPACIGNGQQVLQTQSRNFSFHVTAPNQPGRWDLRFQMHNGNSPFGRVAATTIGIPLDFQASACFDDVQGVCGFFFRHFRPDTGLWHKMTFQGDHWQGPGANQKIFPSSAHPGDNRVARFWKSGFTGRIRVSGEVHDLDPQCGDGVIVKLRRKHGDTGSPILPDITIANGNTSPQTFSVPLNDIKVDESVRFIVAPRATTGCDLTSLDPLIQILPPDPPATGPIPNAQPIFDPEVESD